MSNVVTFQNPDEKTLKIYTESIAVLFSGMTMFDYLRKDDRMHGKELEVAGDIIEQSSELIKEITTEMKQIKERLERLKPSDPSS